MEIQGFFVRPEISFGNKFRRIKGFYFPRQLRQTADTAVASLRAAYDRADIRAANHHYRDYMLSRVFRASDSEADRRLTRQIVSRHSDEKTRASAPWTADETCTVAGGDIYATVMAMLSVDNG